VKTWWNSDVAYFKLPTKKILFTGVPNADSFQENWNSFVVQLNRTATVAGRSIMLLTDL